MYHERNYEVDETGIYWYEAFSYPDSIIRHDVVLFNQTGKERHKQFQKFLQAVRQQGKDELAEKLRNLIGAKEK